MLQASNTTTSCAELAKEFRIAEQSVMDIMARDKLNRQTDAALAIAQNTRNKVCVVTETEVDEMREKISEAFEGMLSDDHNKPRYDYYIHISSIARDFDMDTALVEAYLIRKFDWLSAKLYLLKVASLVKGTRKDAKNTAQDFTEP